MAKAFEKQLIPILEQILGKKGKQITDSPKSPPQEDLKKAPKNTDSEVKSPPQEDLKKAPKNTDSEVKSPPQKELKKAPKNTNSEVKSPPQKDLVKKPQESVRSESAGANNNTSSPSPNNSTNGVRVSEPAPAGESGKEAGLKTSSEKDHSQLVDVESSVSENKDAEPRASLKDKEKKKKIGGMGHGIRIGGKVKEGGDAKVVTSRESQKRLRESVPISEARTQNPDKK
jgi:hypothetical protein